MANRVVTIGRQCGSGGHTIGKLVAQRLGVDFYDKKIVELTAAKTKLSPDFIRSHGECRAVHEALSNRGLRVIDATCPNVTHIHKIVAEAENRGRQPVVVGATDHPAAKGPCVIVGRCADCVLAGKADTLNVFIHSEMSFKIERSIVEHGLEREKAASILTRRDKARAQHYRFYTDQRWGDARHYDLCLDSGRLGVESCVALIVEAYRCMG